MIIKPDDNLLRELSNESNGQWIHDSNRYSAIYRNWCTIGDQTKADYYEDLLRRRLAAIRFERVR